jgi:hypothetical protein
MSGSGDNQTAREIATKEAQERESSRQPNKVTSPGRLQAIHNPMSRALMTASDSDSNSDSSDENVKDDDDAAKKAT